MPLRERRGRAGFTLIELLVVIAIIGVLAALLLPTLNAVRCRSKVSAAQSQIRDMESAIKAYESDYGRYPYDDDPAATHANSLLVAALATPGSRGTPYYAFRRDQQGDANGARVPASGTAFVDVTVAAGAPYPANNNAVWPCFYSAMASLGSPNVQFVNMYFYNERLSENPKPAGTFNSFSFDMWTGSCEVVDPTALPITGTAANLSQAYGGNLNPATSQINNWK